MRLLAGGSTCGKGAAPAAAPPPAPAAGAAAAAGRAPLVQQGQQRRSRREAAAPLAPPPHAAAAGQLQGGQQGPAAPQPPSKPDPFAQKTVYKDSPVDTLLITVFTGSLVDEMAKDGQVVPLPRPCTYDDLVRVSRAVMVNRTPEVQVQLVKRCLLNLTGKGVGTDMYRAAFPPSKWTAELCTIVAASCFGWLIGEAEPAAATIHLGSYEQAKLRERQLSRERGMMAWLQEMRAIWGSDSSSDGSGGGSSGSSSSGGGAGSPTTAMTAAAALAAAGTAAPGAGGDASGGMPFDREQRSVVKIKKCRYLEASGCVGICTNLCKTATQQFFLESAGMPLTMKPNFEDLSCEMIFGQEPPPKEEDEAFQQPCFSLHSAWQQTTPAPPCKLLR